METEPTDGSFLSGEEGEECGALSDSLSRLRSPSVMEAREKGNERLKEELAKAQRVTHTLRPLTFFTPTLQIKLLILCQRLHSSRIIIE